MLKHLYVSCLITLLRNITLSNHNKAKLRNKDKNNFIYDDNLLVQMQQEEALQAPITYRLDNSLKDYIRVLTNKLKKFIIDEIKQILQYYELSEDILQDILLDVISEEDNIND